MMKEYTEHELLCVPEAESDTWVNKKACVTLKDGKGAVDGIIQTVKKSALPNTPQSADFLWVGIKVDGKLYRIDDIESLKILD